MAEQGNSKGPEDHLSPDIKDWSKQRVKEWILKIDGVDDSVAEMLFQQDINGHSLRLLDPSDLKSMGVTFGPTKLIIHARDEVVKLMKENPTSSTNHPAGPCTPYPFCRFHDTHRYMEDSILDITESGASDLIEPCHEYKAFTNVTDETKMGKFTYEVIRFASACMNNRTNGTIHFGIGDKPKFTHGQVLGVVVDDREAYGEALRDAINACFEHKHRQAAQTCIKPPRLVGVLNKNWTSSEKCVIEVDIVPDSVTCEENCYHTLNMDALAAKKKGKKMEVNAGTKSKHLFVRDGGNTLDLLIQPKPEAKVKQFVGGMAKLSQLRKQAEEKHLSVIKSSTQGSRLSHMITGGTLSLDKSHFQQYVLVTNKSHPVQFESLGFLAELNPTAVLDFDPDSNKNGLQRHYEKQNNVNAHLPVKYKITKGVQDIAEDLKLTRGTSWVFCNGGIEDESPSDIDQWLKEKGASVRDVVSFMCRKDVLPNQKFLVVFLLLSTVNEKMDPLVETFITFYQELQGTEQILCLCENEKAFTSWRDLLEARCGIDISDRCIYELSFAEVNGTVLSLLSENRKSSRFLPCGGGSKVLLERKVERSFNTLEVLCVNQCEGGNSDKLQIEENFYKGEKVSWWNFHFSEEPGSTPFIKRDKFDYIIDTVIPEMCSLTKACVVFHLLHVPGCGGTTLAMHILWALRNRFRCAVLKNCKAEFLEVANQVVKLLTNDNKEEIPRVPVLLMLDDFDDKEKVFDLRQLIEKECAKKGIRSKTAQVILLNCMMSESPVPTEQTGNTVFIGNDLSDKEQRLFEEKLKEIEKKHKNAETFYGFMIMKKNFKSEYVEGVARNTLKSFNMNQKHSQLLAILALLDVYCKGSSLSISLCEEFLGLKPKPFCGSVEVKEGFGKFSPLIARCLVEDKVVFEGVKMIHSRLAQCCLQELTSTHNVSKADMSDFLLNTESLYQSTQGNEKLLHDVRQILVKRYHSVEEESQFSPLIQDIADETPGQEEMVLQNASKRFEKDAIILQLLARYYYLKKRDFSEARAWAQGARELSKDNSYIADTSAQVVKHELRNAVTNCKGEPSPEQLEMFLKMAQSATDAFKEAQNLAKKESMLRLNSKKDKNPFNVSGCLGEIQVGVLLIEVLSKTPIFSSDNVRHDILSQVLSGGIKLQDVEGYDKRLNKHRRYYMILREFEDVLYNLKYRMKVNFELLENLYVNLGSRFGIKDSREQRIQNELHRCFSQYAKLFCKTDSASLLKKNITPLLRLHLARQYLEMQKADTYSGVLNRLNNSSSSAAIENIAQHCFVVCHPNHMPTVKERINFIYVNVVMSRIKMGSQFLQPYQTLVQLLCQILREQIPLGDNLPLYYIAVVLLWPHQNQSRPESMGLGKYISLMRTAYHSAMKEVMNGKRPVLHFFLGKKQGYERLIYIEEIKKCVTDEQDQFDSVWENGKIWKEKKVKELLCRAEGEVKGDLILADTCIPKLKVEVSPVFKSELRKHPQGSRVSFFIGFSMKGPLALDID